MGQENRKNEEKGKLKKSTTTEASSRNTKKKQKHSKETLTCLYTNADTITNKFDELKVLLELHKPSIIAVTEVKPKNLATPLTKASLKLDGYKLIPNKQCFAAEGRGISIYISDDMSSSTKETSMEMGAESVWVNITNTDQSITKVGCVYRSPNSSDETNDKLCQSMRSFEEEDNNLIIMGDFNHPEIDWINTLCQKDEEHQASVFLEAVRDGLLVQHIKEPTRWRANQTPNTLDLLFTNKEGLISDVRVHAPLGKSDHGIVIFSIHCGYAKQVKSTPRYLYNKGNYDQVRADLDIDWNMLMSGMDVTQCWDLLKTELIKTTTNNVPKIMETSCRPRKKPLWMNATAITKVKKKHAAWNR